MHRKTTVRYYFIPKHWRKLKCLTIASIGKDVEFLQTGSQSREAVCVVDRMIALESFIQQIFIEHLLCDRHCS